MIDCSVPPLAGEKMQKKRWLAIFNRFPEIPLVGVELGVFMGTMSKWLLAYKPSMHLTMVDIRRRKELDSVLKWFPKETWDFYEMTSHSAAALVPDDHFDFVFVDADHSFEAVKQDIHDWLPKVKPGGWLCGHDFNKVGVDRAVRKTLPSYELDMDNTWFYRRP